MGPKKDVLFLCQYFYPEYISSATLPYDTAKALVKAGLSVDAMCGYPREYNTLGSVPSYQVHQGIGIQRLKYLQINRASAIGRLINYFSFIFAVSLKFTRLRKYKVIIVYSNPPMLPFIVAMASKLFGIKMIFVSYDIYPEIAIATNTISPTSMMTRIMSIINKSVFKHLDQVVALSTDMKEYLLKHRESLKEEQVAVIPNWYEDKGVNDRLESQGGNLIVSYFGNIGTAQDLDTILGAIREINHADQVSFVFAGHGNKMETLRNIVETESLDHVEIFDFLHEEDFQDALSASDCCLVTLAKGLTGLAVPSKTYSYMMAGKPVIAIMEKHAELAKDLLEHKAGYAIEVGETKKLLEAIIELRDHKEKRQLMGKESRKLFLSKYTQDRCTSQYVNLVRKVLEDQ